MVGERCTPVFKKSTHNTNCLQYAMKSRVSVPLQIVPCGAQRPRDSLLDMAATYIP